MDNAHWFVLTGGLLLFIGVTSSVLRRLACHDSHSLSGYRYSCRTDRPESVSFQSIETIPVSGGADGSGCADFPFSAGIKMPVPVKIWRWRAPILLASGSMVVSVGLMTAFGWFVLGLPIGAAILLAALLAPTDPVLATDVQSRHPGDSDKLRFTLTCEAGMNDGSAFPFVVLGMGLLGLHKIGFMGWRWLFLDVVWATAAVSSSAGWQDMGWGV